MNYYIYLISSLPSLSFDTKPPFSFDDFLSRCKGLVSDEDIDIIRNAGETVSDHVRVKNMTFRKRLSFEMMLRNELVKIRSSRKKVDPAKYLREDGYPESGYISHIAINAYRKPSILEAEKALDLERWRYLEELSMGHYFDIDIMIIYACKLLLAEKWDKIRSAETDRMLEEVLN